MSAVNPYQSEKTCDVCKEPFPSDLVQTYVNEKEDKKSGLTTQEKIDACPLCIAEIAGKRAGLKEPFDFSADPEMSKKVAYAQGIREGRKSSSKAKTAKAESTDADADAKAAAEKAEADAEAQRQLDEEEAERQRLEAEKNASSDEGQTNMLEPETATQLEDETPKRRGGRGSH